MHAPGVSTVAKTEGCVCVCYRKHVDTVRLLAEGPCGLRSVSEQKVTCSLLVLGRSQGHVLCPEHLAGCTEVPMPGLHREDAWLSDAPASAERVGLHGSDRQRALCR